MQTKIFQLGRLALPLAIAISAASCGKFADPTLQAGFAEKQRSLPPPKLYEVEYNSNRNLLWGDLHIHTAYSFDAFTMGTRALPDDAYRHMKGETIEHAFAYPIRASRPLHFGAVTDHAENLGQLRYSAGNKKNQSDVALADALREGNKFKFSKLFLQTIFGKMGSPEARKAAKENNDAEVLDAANISAQQVSLDVWQSIIDSAERHNLPGQFTTFIAYEWSSMPEENNLHRNVIYKSNRVPALPFSSLDSPNPEDLWAALDRQRENGMDAMAIPHNGNASDGDMYRSTDFSGEPMDQSYAEIRTRNEPVSEIFQIKGSSETHPELSPNDAFAGFEIMDDKLSAKVQESKPQGSYARDALLTGIRFSSNQGFNPYLFGVIGSSDSHNASSSVEEDNYHGKLPIIDGSAAQRLGIAFVTSSFREMAVYGASGLTAVWAEENTRDAIFEAMRRRESYATSGTRISLRFFAGWNFDEDILRGDWLSDAYESGVPMGSKLTAHKTAPPKFLVVAMKDPIGANLDRVQIVKGWVDADGNSHERVFDVAASGDRMSRQFEGEIAAVGNTVDVENANYTNSIGSPQLASLWQDPNYDPSQHAFYYARAIEIPTPRYTTYDAALMNVTAPEPTSIQERAVGSAIWIEPLH